MNDEKRPLIIIKRVKRGSGGHVGGAWKIAYADFVTAMMAFFLLMWLLGSTAKGDLQGIADYFNNPMTVSMSGGSGAGDASSVIQGGGTDLSRKAGQVMRGDIEAKKKAINIKAAQAEHARVEGMKLRELKSRLEAVVEASAGLQPFKDQLKLDITDEGLRIQILDERNRPMFDSGGARLKDYTRVILHEIGKVLNGVEYKTTLSGHTDATPYVSGERAYSNWELSADRANASRRELIAGGMDEKKILRVVGLSSAVPFKAEDPFDPSNRRISIIVVNRKTEELIRGNGASAEVGSAGEAKAAIAPGAPPK
ncbi:MAG: flagellar motor protein MotB [Betaproteobacteria bacterium]|nr:flagellar motor protein MotB [Betaproteobacteria bacterium]